MHNLLFVDALVALVATLFNLAYFFYHPNGKKYIRAVSALVLGYFSLIQFLAFFLIISPDTYGQDFLRAWLPVLYSIPIFDIIIDWKKKSKALPPPVKKVNLQRASTVIKKLPVKRKKAPSPSKRKSKK